MIKMRASQGIIHLGGFIPKGETFEVSTEQQARQLEITKKATRISGEAEPDTRQTIGPANRQIIYPKTKEEN